MKTTLFVLSMVLLISSSSCEIHIAHAKSGCKDKCANVTIPFPFGIGPGCFLDNWYEIVCEGNGTTLPRLKKTGVEVLDILLPTNNGKFSGFTGGQLKMNLPISYDDVATPNCTVASKPQSVKNSTDFIGSNFYYADDNLFIAAGCNNSIFVRNVSGASVGCQTKCSRGHTNSMVCDESMKHSCCQDKIRSVFFQALDIDFQKDRVGDQNTTVESSCSFAFLADQSWLIPKITDLESVRITGHTPVLMNWGVSNKSNIGIDFLTNTTTAFSCEGNEVFTQCYCIHGFSGNAYLADGCQDINECENSTMFFCGDGRDCVNHKGSYSCVDSNRTIKLVLMSVGPVIGAFFLLLFGRWLYNDIKRRKKLKLKQKFFKKNGGLLLRQQLSSPESNVERGKVFDSKELKNATGNFNKDRILGQGGQGTVYKGMLTDGRIVAIKKSIVLDDGNVEQFINEVFILSQINHRNIVKLLGWCLETEVPLLVYEFIPNGTLHKYLHNPDEEFVVPWNVRLRLATEVAGAIAYLHSAASKPIYHRDIKTANILLDDQYRAKIADFGTSRSVSLDQTHVTTLIQGTLGYLDPEYFQSSQFTDKSDVYSFGVVLVELLTGKKPISSLFANEGRSLVTQFIILMEENLMFDILDARVLNQGKKEEIIEVVDLARRCLQLNGRNRPSMREVAMELDCVVKKSQQQYSDVQIMSNRETAVLEIEAHDAALISKLNDGFTTMSDVYPLLSGDL